ncbi:MAG: hypothetical protein MUC48_09885 [Leptolyngbya sp. Prado105]|jgi:uncharacterized protein YbjT (DUF2867 family)|nr:hypothetical protein [Leptolyngbya sp. Prado105]
MISITGATGNIGKTLVERLRDRQIPFRIGARKPEDGLRFGQAEAIEETLPNLLNRPAHKVREYVQDDRELWQKTNHATNF